VKASSNNCILLKNLFIIFLFSCFATYAQIGGENDFYIRGAANFGGLIVQNYTATTTYKFIDGFDLNYIKPSSGKKLWQHENNFPEHGFGLTCFDLNNPKVFGNVYASYIFCDIPLSKKEKPFRLYMRLAAGLAYAPVHFNATKNPYNDMLSAPLDGYGNLKWFFRWNLSKQLCWDLGLSFSHISDGSSNLPNLGLNIMTVNTGLIYKFINPVKNIITQVDSGSQRRTKYEVLLWAGIGKVQEYVFGNKYQAQSYSAAFYSNIRNTHKIGAGIDMFYNGGNIELLKEEGINLSSNFQNIQTGIKVSYVYNLGRLSIPIEMGAYVISKYKEATPFYERIGVRYYFKNNIVALVTLRIYWIQAYNLEFGIGYRIGVKS